MFRILIGDNQNSFKASTFDEFNEHRFFKDLTSYLLSEHTFKAPGGAADYERAFGPWETRCADMMRSGWWYDDNAPMGNCGNTHIYASGASKIESALFLIKPIVLFA